MELLEELGIRLVCTTAGSPYYNPHIQRPAYFPPSDGYQPPEDPLVGVARQIQATAELKRAAPESDLCWVRATRYLQDWLPQWRRRSFATGMVDSVGLGPNGVVVSRPAGRRACRTSADAEKDLPHVQRLHDRTAKRNRQRLLSTRSVLQSDAGTKAAERDQESNRRRIDLAAVATMVGVVFAILLDQVHVAVDGVLDESLDEVVDELGHQFVRLGIHL